MDNTCVCCGVVIPEGRQVCPRCEASADEPDLVLPDGTRLYLKPKVKPEPGSVQRLIYDLLGSGDDD